MDKINLIVLILNILVSSAVIYVVLKKGKEFVKEIDDSLVTCIEASDEVTKIKKEITKAIKTKKVK